MGLIQRARDLLGLPDQIREQRRLVERALARDAKKSSAASAKSERTLVGEIAALRTEAAALRKEVEQKLQQYHLQLGRLSAVIGGTADVALTSERIPVAVDSAGAALAAVRPEAGEWLSIAACPACATHERTVVCEWNKLALLDAVPDERSWVYDYAVCHGCGILYATERPAGNRYRYLLEHFEDVVDKDTTNPLLNPRPLSDADRARYRALISRGVFVSDHEGGDYLYGVFKDRADNAMHVDLLGSLLNLRGARVLEVRSRAGTISEGLRRLYGADVCAMPLWPSQQMILRELYDIPTSDVIDFENFTVPFEGRFDLIACNHMFNHAVRLDRFLTTVRGALNPGGHLYLYNEIDDREFLEAAQSMIATMNPLHLQAADPRSLMRALAAAGFETVFLKTRSRRNLVLARASDRQCLQPMSDSERSSRIAQYRRARDRAVLRTREGVRPRFAHTWSATVERAVATGVAVFDATGAVRVVKP